MLYLVDIQPTYLAIIKEDKVCIPNTVSSTITCLLLISLMYWVYLLRLTGSYEWVTVTECIVLTVCVVL